jgi:hypothetical protein
MTPRALKNNQLDASLLQSGHRLPSSMAPSLDSREIQEQRMRTNLKLAGRNIRWRAGQIMAMSLPTSSDATHNLLTNCGRERKGTNIGEGHCDDFIV